MQTAVTERRSRQLAEPRPRCPARGDLQPATDWQGAGRRHPPGPGSRRVLRLDDPAVLHLRRLPLDSPGHTKALLRRLDHAAIFLFIAGSYTPFMLGSIADEGGYWILALVWLVATAGTVAKCANRLTHPVLSTAVYLGLGWLSVFILKPLMNSMPMEGLTLILSGGMLYTLGAVVFHFDDRIPYGHFIWHLLVLLASGCHFLAILKYVAA
ncbi:hypothetical protein HK415_12415 [Ramlibacter sp. B156]|uniref:Hemolysin III family protein n=1 Tax=Ramlibacter montanisoli TaxID=2732512 RepID=A0A849KCA9_9BURK|nr:hypothetical protein [Ramlibacter montanisoli]